jgi:hypothetical protein
MRALAFVCLVALLAGCAPRGPRLGPPAPVAATVEVVKAGETWTATFHLPTQAPAWVFARSSLARVGQQPWREGAWSVETAGVRLERHGLYDMLVAEGGGNVPAAVRIRFTPVVDELQTDSAPAIRFSTGATALFSGQFGLFAMPAIAAADALPGDLSGVDIPYTRTRATFRDEAGPVLYAGQRLPSVAVDEDDGTYVLFGPAVPALGGGIATIIDPALPAWLREVLLRMTPAILERYTMALGPPPGAQPMLMVSWAGPTPHRTSMRGSTLPDLLAMTFEGEGVVHENPAVRDRALWFIAHESAHFWLGEAIVNEYARDAWITEGGADLLAIRAVAAADPQYDWRGELQKAVDDCVRLSAGRGVASADERGEQRAYYACGAVFGLVAEAASHHEFSGFVRRLVKANRGHRVVTREAWLATVDRVSHDPSLSRDIAVLLDRGAADPGAAIASLFTRAGVPFAAGASGVPQLR